ncbi:hypothetical protein KZ305_27725, partial [Escherichia coli]|uniref:hypothetical protein n=1 Tax=Escherichia coli TaxID=562 RepID=UPI001ED9D1AE
LYVPAREPGPFPARQCPRNEQKHRREGHRVKRQRLDGNQPVAKLDKYADSRFRHGDQSQKQ